MIATADGRATIAGRAGGIANRADYELFHATRARMDAIMVGAETVRVESYGRTINNAEARERREREGLPGDPMAVLVTRRVSLPADVGLLRAPENTVIVLTPSPDGRAARRGRGHRALPARAGHRRPACGGCATSSASARSCARAGRTSTRRCSRPG